MDHSLPQLNTRVFGRHLEWLDEVDSTNDYVKRNFETMPHGAAVIADCQTGGKGRLGRNWHARVGDCLCLSVCLQQLRTQDLARLPLLTALAVQEGLQELCGVPFGIKWSNDILYRGEKVCGILCESRVSVQGASAVLGIGINLMQTKEEFARLSLVYATSLFLATNRPYTPQNTAKAVLEALEGNFLAWRQEGFAPLLRRYRQACVTLGHPVRIVREGREQEGRALDVTETGALLCEIGGRQVEIHAGEASVRGLMGYAD